MKNYSNKKYIYNPQQATFYINNGIQALEVGVHFRTKKMFWVFDYNKTEDVYLLWLNRDRNKKQM